MASNDPAMTRTRNLLIWTRHGISNIEILFQFNCQTRNFIRIVLLKTDWALCPCGKRKKIKKNCVYVNYLVKRKKLNGISRKSSFRKRQRQVQPNQVRVDTVIVPKEAVGCRLAMYSVDSTVYRARVFSPQQMGFNMLNPI